MCLNWLRDRWHMMCRVKPRYLSMLNRKRSSTGSVLKGTSKDGGKYSKSMACAVNASIVCYSIALGVSLGILRCDVTVTVSTMLLSSVVAGVISILSGLCLAEYLSKQCTSSVYSACYQGTGEFLAFLIGWTWLASQTTTAAAICKILSHFLNLSTENTLQLILEKGLFSYAADAPAALFAVCLGLILLTGMSEAALWFVMCMPVAAVLMGTAAAVATVSSGGMWEKVDVTQWGEIQDVEMVLSTSAILLLFYSGPHSIIRIPQFHIRGKSSSILGPLNIISFVAAFTFLLTSQSPKTLTGVAGDAEHPETLAICIIFMTSLILVGIEVFYPLNLVIHDMASDGLIFRSLGKKWTPFCFPVAPPFVHVATVVAVGVVSVLASLEKILKMAVLCPVFVNSVVPLLVIWQRYRDNNSWQYEPMFQTSTQTLPKYRSRSKSHEFQFVKNPGYDVTEAADQSQESSDTDVDAVVEQYKEQTRIANLERLDDPSSQEEPEPTPTTAKRAKLCVFLLLTICVVNSVVLNVANVGDDAFAIVTIALCLLLACVVFAVLAFLPHNSDSGGANNCSKRIAKSPLVPGLASLAASSLLVHCVIGVWEAILSWLAIGLLVYFVYGARSSTAATSFHNLRAGHVTLQPLPNHAYNCVPQVVASHRKLSKSKILKIRHR